MKTLNGELVLISRSTVFIAPDGTTDTIDALGGGCSAAKGEVLRSEDLPAVPLLVGPQEDERGVRVHGPRNLGDQIHRHSQGKGPWHPRDQIHRHSQGKVPVQGEGGGLFCIGILSTS